MEAAVFLDRLQRQRDYAAQIVHVELIPPRAPAYADLTGGLHLGIATVLAEQGITQLYTHQSSAIAHVRAGRNVVVVTGTASGKTLCYYLPIVETLAADPLATALCLYPTKALTQDQLRGLSRFQNERDGVRFLAGTYDGDTPANLRRKLRDNGNVVLTNPDMLHCGILPQHARWSRFFSHLQYVVIDEIHAYRGVFGSHLANVLRRLRRICAHYGATPRFICCSATIANPREHAERICGAPLELVANDGSPRGPKHFVLWNPPPLTETASGPAESWRTGGERRSSLWEAIWLLTALVRENVQTIAFVNTRLSAELLFKGARDCLRAITPRLGDAVCAYRGGYLPEERREIERRLAARELLGVASTNALELGLDIGSLDACLMVGYPGMVASLWQRAGRAGRGREPALVFLIAQNGPVDQYLMAHSPYLFGQPPEHAVIDPDNPHVTVGHLKCAAQELPLRAEERELFGSYSQPLLELLVEDGCLRATGGCWYWARSEYPAAEVSLRNIAGPIYTIQDESAAEQVIGTMDETSALAQLHDHAVYLHAGESYFVNRLDLGQKIAHVEKRELDYYTQSVQTAQIRIDETADEQAWGQSLLGFGDVTVTTSIPMFKKIRFHSRSSLGYENLELPPQSLETVALWLAPPADLAAELRERGLAVGEGLVGIGNVFVEVAPLYVTCDVMDIGSVMDAGCLGRDALFIYDRYPGGMGYAKRCKDRIAEILPTVFTVIRECSCEFGCPSCVGSPITSFAGGDLDRAMRGRIPDKRAALALLTTLLGEPPAPA